MLNKLQQNFRGHQAAILISLLSGFLIICKVFFIKDCWAFDMNDDANHTFPNLFVARMAFKLGQIPQMNFFNNFGSPLLGDALTYPFAIHSLTYWFFESPMAMTVNRFIFAALTIYLGYLYFKKYLKDFSSILCSFWVFFSAVNLWFFATYHMQLALFFEFLLLYLNQRSPLASLGSTLAIFITCTIMILSLSVNLSVFILAFLLASQIIEDKRLSKKSILLLVSVASAVIVTWFQFGAFIQGMQNSSRLHNHYSELAIFDLPLLIKHILFYSRVRWHPDATVFLSVPVVIFAIMGIFIMRKQNKLYFSKAIMLGIITPILSYTLMTLPSIWWRIPLLNATDLTRVLWLALPFMFLSVGTVIDAITENRFVRSAPTPILLSVLIAFISIAFAKGEWESVKAIIGISDMHVCRLSHHFNLLKDYKMHPANISNNMTALSRFTCDGPSWVSDDFRGVYAQLLGSNQRAITSDQTLTQKLLDNDLIEIENDPNKTYHFKAPWKAETLNQLGIRYLLLREKIDENNHDWHLIKYDDEKYLYENKLNPSPIYYQDQNKITPINTYKIHGNQIIIDLPATNSARELVASFLNFPDYKAKLDGIPVKLFTPDNEFPFIHVNVSPGNHVLTLDFERYTWTDLFIFACSGLGFCLLASLLILRLK